MKSILIFGASSAMAEQAARLWASQGNQLFLVARNAEKLDAVAADLRVRGEGAIHTYVADLDDNTRHVAILDAAREAFGREPDIALVAHGILGDQAQEQSDFQAAEGNLWTNFVSAASLASHLANRMEAAGQGTIAVISSVAGDRGRQSNYVYGSAKAGLNAFLSGLRNRLQDKGVKVVTIKPGFVDTPMTAHIEKKGPLFASAEKAGKLIVKHADKGTAIAYLPWFWRYIMLIIRHIPETFFKRLKL